VLASSKEQAGAQDLDKHGLAIVPAVGRIVNPANYARRMMRRLLRLLVPLGIAYVLVWLYRQRQPTPAPAAAPTWPPVTPPRADPTGGPATPAEEDVPTVPSVAASAEPIPPQSWIAPNGEGMCPTSHPIKAKLSSKIFHLPGMFAYNRTQPDRCYASEDAAVADGLRRAKR
jgi:hypothetical protein